MFTQFHSVLGRQLVKSGYTAQDLAHDERLNVLLSKINNFYEDADKGRYLKERALELSSHEMQQLYNTITSEKEELEKLVNELVEKDKTLLEINNQLTGEISERERAEKNVAELNKQLIIAARRAGMADIATSTLHNIGNILNSVNTSISMIAEKINNSEMKSLSEVGKMLKQHESDIAKFILEDTRGKNIPRFLSILIDAVDDENSMIAGEIDSLSKDVEHIKNIITVQQTLNTAIGMTEEVSPDELVEDALKLTKTDYQKSKITIERSFMPLKKVVLDKIKLLQVVVNLIKNAIDSLFESNVDGKKLILCIKEKDDSHFIIEITDNGVGIPAQNMVKIFSYGFTTKKNGHGFGLHSSANAVQEMGGHLEAASAGVDKGATFILTLPYNPVKKKDVLNEQ